MEMFRDKKPSVQMEHNGNDLQVSVKTEIIEPHETPGECNIEQHSSTMFGISEDAPILPLLKTKSYQMDMANKYGQMLDKKQFSDVELRIRNSLET